MSLKRLWSNNVLLNNAFLPSTISYIDINKEYLFRARQGAEKKIEKNPVIWGYKRPSSLTVDFPTTVDQIINPLGATNDLSNHQNPVFYTNEAMELGKSIDSIPIDSEQAIDAQTLLKNDVNGLSLVTNFLPLPRSSTYCGLAPNTKIPSHLAVIQDTPFFMHPEIRNCYNNYHRMLTPLQKMSFDEFYEKLNDDTDSFNMNNNMNNGGDWTPVYRIPASIDVDTPWIINSMLEKFNKGLGLYENLDLIPMLRFDRAGIMLMKQIYDNNKEFAKAMWEKHKHQTGILQDTRESPDGYDELKCLFEGNGDNKINKNNKNTNTFHINIEDDTGFNAVFNHKYPSDDILLFSDMMIEDVPISRKNNYIPIPLPLLPGSIGRACYFYFRVHEEKLFDIKDFAEQCLMELQLTELYEFMKEQHEIFKFMVMGKGDKKLQYYYNTAVVPMFPRYKYNNNNQNMLFYQPKSLIHDSLPQIPKSIIPNLYPIEDNKIDKYPEFMPSYLSPIAKKAVQYYHQKLHENGNEIGEFYEFWDGKDDLIKYSNNPQEIQQFEDDIDEMGHILQDYYHESAWILDHHYDEMGIMKGTLKHGSSKLIPKPYIIASKGQYSLIDHSKDPQNLIPP